MPRTIILDSFPVSSLGKIGSSPPTLTDRCRQWVMSCVAAGNTVLVPAITYYETLRELERLNAPGQIARLKTFCLQPDRFIPLETAHLETAAQLWGQARRAGQPTADPKELDGDVILAAQAIGLGLPASDYVIATTNPGHIARYAPCDLWTNIRP